MRYPNQIEDFESFGFFVKVCSNKIMELKERIAMDSASTVKKMKRVQQVVEESDNCSLKCFKCTKLIS